MMRANLCEHWNEAVEMWHCQSCHLWLCRDCYEPHEEAHWTK